MADKFTSYESWGADDIPNPPADEQCDEEGVTVKAADDLAALAERMRLGKLTEADDRARVEGRLGD